MVANRLATNGEDWTKIFSKYNSGTYNNQYMVLNYNLFEPRKPIQDGLLWIVEQLPGKELSLTLAFNLILFFRIYFYMDIIYF